MKRGFSRIETVLVLSATGIVATVALPILAQSADYQREFENARRASCQANLKQIGLGVMQYMQDYDETYPRVALARRSDMLMEFPLGVAGNSPEHIGAPQPFHYDAFGWADVILPYNTVLQIFQCPSKTRPFQKNPRRAGFTDYWFNANLSGRQLPQVENTERTILSGDGDSNSPKSNARYNLKSLPKSWGWAHVRDSPERRHFNGANYLFADGHVKWMRAGILKTPAAKGAYTFSIR